MKKAISIVLIPVFLLLQVFPCQAVTLTNPLTTNLTKLPFENIEYSVLSESSRWRLYACQTSLIGTAASSLIGAGMDGVKVPMYDGSTGKIIGYYTLTGTDALTYTFNNSIFPNAIGELAYYGIQELGESLGIDQTITSIGGLILRSGLQSGFSSGWDFGDILKSATTGLLQGVASIGINYATQELGLNPLIANIGFSALSLGIEGIINGDGIFDHIFEQYTNNALTFLGYNPKPDMSDYWVLDPSDMWVFNEGAYNRDISNYYWQESSYLSNIQDFTKIIQERGLVDALDTYATSFFNSVAVNSVVRTGMSVGEYIVDKLNQGQYTVETMKDGTTAKKVDLEGSGESALIGEEGDLEWLKGKLFEGGVVYGDLGVDPYNKIGLLDGYVDETYGTGLDYNMDIYKGNPSLLWLGNGDTTFVRMNPFDNSSAMRYGSDGELTNTRVWDYLTGRSIGFENDSISNASVFDTISQQIYLTDTATLVNLSGSTFADIFGDGNTYEKTSIASKLSEWTSSFANVISKPVDRGYLATPDFIDYVTTYYTDEAAKNFAISQYNQYAAGPYSPDINLTAENKLLTLDLGSIKISASNELTVKFDGNPEGSTNLRLDIDALNKTASSIGIKSDFNVGRYGLEIYGSGSLEGITPSISAGLNITKPWFGDQYLSNYNEFAGEFTRDVNNDGMITFRLGTGIESGSSTNGLTLEVSIDKDKYGEVGATVVGIGLIGLMAYAAYSAYQGDLRPAMAGAAAIAIADIYDTIKQAIAVSNIT